MGKRLEPRTYVLEWGSGTYLEGATIRMRATPIDVSEKLENAGIVESLPAFFEYLIDWDIEVPDAQDPAEYVPLERTPEAMTAALEMPVVKAIVQEWYKAAIGVSAPLDRPSGDGQPSPDTESVEQSIAMESF